MSVYRLTTCLLLCLADEPNKEELNACVKKITKYILYKIAAIKTNKSSNIHVFHNILVINMDTTITSSYNRVYTQFDCALMLVTGKLSCVTLLLTCLESWKLPIVHI